MNITSHTSDEAGMKNDVSLFRLCRDATCKLRGFRIHFAAAKHAPWFTANPATRTGVVHATQAA